METSSSRFRQAMRYFSAWQRAQQFTLRDLFWLVLLLSIACAWWVDNRSWWQIWFDYQSVNNHERIALERTNDQLVVENQSLRKQLKQREEARPVPGN